jgi:DNA-binding GntR family transcriptional regulator
LNFIARGPSKVGDGLTCGSLALIAEDESDAFARPQTAAYVTSQATTIAVSVTAAISSTMRHSIFIGPLDIFELARQHGLKLGRARESIRNVLAGVQVAAALRVDRGTRLQKRDRIVHTADGIPIEWRVSFDLPGH